MTPERWRQISKIFHAAKQHEAAEQLQFVAAACGDDATCVARSYRYCRDTTTEQGSEVHH